MTPHDRPGVSCALASYRLKPQSRDAGHMRTGHAGPAHSVETAADPRRLNVDPGRDDIWIAVRKTCYSKAGTMAPDRTDREIGDDCGHRRCNPVVGVDG